MYKYTDKNVTGLSEALRKLRYKHGLTQAEVAERLHLARSTYSKYESGRVPEIEALKNIAKIYSISLDELLSGLYSENGKNCAILKSGEIDDDSAQFFPLTEKEKKLLVYFRGCSHPSDVLKYVKNIYLDDVLGETKEEKPSKKSGSKKK